MIFGSWDSLIRIAVVGILAYAGLILFLRISGNRTLSKMNSFDLIVTIALGSTLSSGLLQKSVPLVDTLFAFALLIGLQYLITWLASRFPTIDHLVKSEPKLVYKDGCFLKNVMKKSRVSEDEIRAAAREQGHSTLEKVKGVILESNGQLTAFS